MFDDIVGIIRRIYGDEALGLHEPRLDGKERQYAQECLDSGYVSSVGAFVTRFEEKISEHTGAVKTLAVANATCGLHLALHVLGVAHGDAVLTQALTFVGTANAIKHAGGEPIFLDSDSANLGLSPERLRQFLDEQTIVKGGVCLHRKTNQIIKACIPVHIFGHAASIQEIVEICHQHHIAVIEDAAEAMGSFSHGQHLGTFGDIGVVSFNGNKIMTTGGGGACLFRSQELADKARHVGTTAKQPHAWEFFHDVTGFNFRMPNINAALGCAQLERLDEFVTLKRAIASRYKEAFDGLGIAFLQEPEGSRSNFWLNAIYLKDRQERDAFLQHAHEQKVFCRPIWNLMTDLPMYRDCEHDALSVARGAVERIVCLPSSAHEPANA